MKGSLREHQELVDAILLALSATRKCRAWKQVNGLFRAFDDPEQVIRVGLVGSADVTGFRFGDGKRFELEAKTGEATQTKEQKNFQKVVLAGNAIYAVCRTTEEALGAVFPDGVYSVYMPVTFGIPIKIE